MAFNVSTIDGEHIGITYASALQPGSLHIGGSNRRIIQVALTDQKIEDFNFDYERIKRVIAERHSAKTILGKIKEVAFLCDDVMYTS